MEFFRINCNGSHEEFWNDFEKSKREYDSGKCILFDDSMEGNIFNCVISLFLYMMQIPVNWL